MVLCARATPSSIRKKRIHAATHKSHDTDVTEEPTETVRWRPDLHEPEDQYRTVCAGAEIPPHGRDEEDDEEKSLHSTAFMKRQSWEILRRRSVDRVVLRPEQEAGSGRMS